MLQVEHITKRFEQIVALDDISCVIPDGCICGLVGSNGAGKSTLLRTICGIYRPDSGEVRFDGHDVFSEPAVKADLVFVPDDLFFLPNATPLRQSKLFRAVYPPFDEARFAELLQAFRLPYDRPIQSFSKGMKRLTATALALAARPKLVLFDETMDGLDPVMRHVVKSVLAADVLERSASAVCVSHSLRELEDLCDQLALFHGGKLLMERDITSLKNDAFKAQVAFDHPVTREDFKDLQIVQFQSQGSVATIVGSGDRAEAEATLRAMKPLLLDLLPLTLEEVFLFELQTKGYDRLSIFGGDGE